MKPNVIHIIQDLGRGGAETMLISLLKELGDYNNIIITLGDRNEFKEELKQFEHLYVSLHSKPSFFRLPFQVIKFRRLLKKLNADLVHSHLPFANFVARIATPQNVPLITTLHIPISNNYNNKTLFWIDKLTLSFRQSILIACSNTVLKDYKNSLKLKSVNAKVIHNPVKISEKTVKEDFCIQDKFRLVCVASFKAQKNIQYLIKLVSKFKDQSIELHLFGDGLLQKKITNQIRKLDAPVIQHGLKHNIRDLLKNYDLFVMASLYEGFSIAVLEAMATRLPLLLSDIPSFREEATDCAIYFDLSDERDFINKVLFLKDHKEYRMEIANKGFERVNKNFTVDCYLKSLRVLYQDLLTK